MSQPSGNISATRFLQLVAVALAIPLGVWALLGASTGFFYSSDSTDDDIRAAQEAGTRAQFAALQKLKRQGLVQVAAENADIGAGVPLQSGDEFYRQQRLGVGTSDGQGNSAGAGLLHAVKHFVRRGDVLEREVVGVDESGKGWNIFAGSYGPAWFETTQWCLRLHYLPGEEDSFAYGLWPLRGEIFGDRLGLPELDPAQAVTPQNASQFPDPRPWQDLLLPLKVAYSGEGKYTLTPRTRTWQIEMESPVCALSRRQRGQHVAVPR